MSGTSDDWRCNLAELGGNSELYKFHCQGTHRISSLLETFERVKPFFELFGITRIANVTGLDQIGIPVVMVCRPNARSLAVSQGKGLCLDAAKCSGVMESIEAYHAETIEQPLRFCSYDELCHNQDVIDVMDLPSSELKLFHTDRRMLWIRGYDILSGTETWVPHEMVHLDYRLPAPSGSGCFIISSNGLASGNHLLEAISHALCEVIERDATTLGRREAESIQRSRRLDLSTVDDPPCSDLLSRFDRAGVAVSVWDVTNDVGIASFVCTIQEKTCDPIRRLYAASGMGTHPAREVAMLRALTEAAQSRLTFIAGSRDDMTRSKYKSSRDPAAIEMSLRATAIAQPTRNFHDVPTFISNRVNDDVHYEIEHLFAAGIRQIVVVDLTKDYIGIPVVRVVVPGLEGSDHAPGYTPGRRALAVMQA